MCACKTVSCAISALVGPFETSPRSDRRSPEGGWKRCVDAQPEVPLKCSLGRLRLSFSIPGYLSLSRHFIFNNISMKVFTYSVFE